MKKHFSVLLGILVSLSSLFISCGDKDGDLQPTICKITVQSSGDGDGTVSITNYIGTSVNALIGSNVEIVATPADGSAFIGWYVSGSNTPVSTDARFVFIASENITLIARFAKLSNLTLHSAGNGSVCFKGTNKTSLAVLPGSEVTVVATPNEDCDFVGWFIGESDAPVSTDTEYTFTVTENVTLIAQFVMSVVVDVDLGLPSGLKWANMNVGASSPEDYGNYYAWGETTTKSNYTRDSYQYHNGSSFLHIGSNISGTQYDVARAQWGGSWRLPTEAEIQELVDRCSWTWTTYNGVNGYKVTGPNGNSIFLPAAGCRDGTEIYDRGSIGDYWSGTLGGDYSDYAYYLDFGSGDLYVGCSYRGLGLTVRPVSE